ncbi:hypothetical protein [Lacticaseibacillus mingshuiensis]|uniref:Holin n=1 Tax=Lacticaseibacillus mingshuiensis TaxID=2799574 RepID=A0ABW4CD25_9LACO|nr:hypothetical protein [Lacticaseibacillus mingshuiensis]
MKKVRIDVTSGLYSVGIVLMILTASNILPIAWSDLCTYWLLTCTYGTGAMLTQGIISEVKRANDKR